MIAAVRSEEALMPVAVVQDWVEPVTEHSTESYDRITERLGAKDDPPRGLLMHSAGHTGEGFRIFEVWESQADFDVFMVDRLMPILRETTGSVSTPPQVTIYELHNYIAT
jgi:hypothetical protein